MTGPMSEAVSGAPARTTLRVERAGPSAKIDGTPGLLYAMLAVAIITLIAFVPVLSAQFVNYDDPVFVTQNPQVHGLTPANIRWMTTALHAGHWHPLTFASWALDYELWGGLKPGGFHFTGLLLHIATACALVGLLRQLCLAAVSVGVSSGSQIAGRWATLAGLIGALVFAVHPLRVESVAWVTERRDVLSGFWLVLAAWLYVRSVEPGSDRIASLRSLVGAIVCLCLSCMSKAWGMSFFVLMLVLDVYPLRRLPMEPWQWLAKAHRGAFVRVLAQKLPFIAIGVITAALAAAAQNQALAAKSLERWGVVDRLAQSVYGLGWYASKTLAPTGLVPFYELPRSMSFTESRVLIAGVFVLVLGVLAVVLRRKLPALVSAAAIYVVCLLPVLGFLQSGDQLVADRYSYIASFGLSGLIAGGVVMLARRDLLQGSRRVLAGLVSAIVITALGLLTFAQAAVWTNSVSLWTHTLREHPSAHAYLSLAIELETLKQPALALEAVKRATDMDPQDGKAWFMRGNLSQGQGDLADAERAFIAATRTLPQAYMAYVNLGLLLDRRGDAPGAMSAFRQAVADVERGGPRPLSAIPYLALGDALLKTGDTAGARTQYARALTFDETRAEATKKLAELDKRLAPK